jgi:hypothetical protein
MTVNLKFYKIKLLEKFLKDTASERFKLLQELKVNATDPVLYKRRIRMLKHLSQFEFQILEKIDNFDTDDAEDLSLYGVSNISGGLSKIVNRSA